MKYLFSMLLFCAALTLSAESKFLKVSEFQYDFDKKSITFQVENTSGKDISSFDCKLELEIDRRDFDVYANGSNLKKGEKRTLTRDLQNLNPKSRVKKISGNPAISLADLSITTMKFADGTEVKKSEGTKVNPGNRKRPGGRRSPGGQNSRVR